MSEVAAAPDPLRPWTPARVALGRAGASLPTAALLALGEDHALARDAVAARLDAAALAEATAELGLRTRMVRSAAADRAEYLRRPDLGRRLADESRERLREAGVAGPQRLTIVVGDGLSALAANTHAVPLLRALLPSLAAAWAVEDVVLAEGARVALGDEVATLRGAEAVLVLLGERPGLRAADSLGAYVTYRPRVGCLDSARNCVSNIRGEGLSYADAAARLASLLHRARALGATGVALKGDDGLAAALP